MRQMERSQSNHRRRPNEASASRATGGEDGGALADPLRGTLDGSAHASPEQFPHQRKMERAFGRSFANVSVKTGDQSVGENHLADGLASGEHIRFADHNPDVETVAHELAHVDQQNGKGQRQSTRPEPAGDQAAPQEQEADQVARAAARGSRVRTNREDARPVLRRKGSKRKIKKALKRILKLCRMASSLVGKKKWDLAREALKQSKKLVYKLEKKFRPALVLIGLIDLADKAIAIASKIPFPTDAAAWAVDKVIDAVEALIDQL